MHIRPAQCALSCCSPSLIRPPPVRTLARTLFQPCNSTTLSEARTLPPRPAPLRPIHSITWKPQHQGRLNTFQTIHTTSSTTRRPGSTDKNTSSEQVYDLSLQLSQRPMNGNALMRYTLYTKNGLASQIGELPKLGIADRYGLSTRDLRVFDLPSGGFPHVLVRENTILIHLFDLRLLVQDDQALLFHITEGANPTGYNELGDDCHWPRTNSPGKTPSSVSRVFSHNLEMKIRDGQGFDSSTSQPYELRIVEGALASVTSVLEAEYLLTEKKVTDALRLTNINSPDREESLIHRELDIILDLTRKLAGIEHRARQVRNAVQEILNEDEDMAKMHLTDKRAGKPHSLQDHQDVEYIFEAYFKASDAVVQETSSLMENIRRTEETIQSTLRVRRNQIMVLEAKIEILMLALAWGTLVAGWYGMNVINYFEESAHAFAVLVSISLAGIVSGSWYGMRKLRHIHKLRI